MIKHRHLPLLAALLALTLAACGSSSSDPDSNTEPPPPPPPAAGEWTLVWSDEFEGDAIDSSKWSHEVNCWGGGNNELQCYTDREENSFVEDGKLYIQARQESYSGPGVNDDHPDYDPEDTSVTQDYTSARLRTKDKGDWKYGRVEINARMPEGQGMWPAIWMLPTEWVHGGWPLSGEIDIFEAVNINASGGNQIHGTLHYGREWPHNLFSSATHTPVANIWEEFHTYAIEWEEGEIRWYVNDTHYATQTEDGWFTYYWGGQEQGYQLGEGAAPFDELFHLILNVAVGGQWPGDPDENTEFPQQMVVEYVRVYECSIDPATGAGCATDIDPDVGVQGHLGQKNVFPLFADGASQLGSADTPLTPAFWEAAGGNIIADPALDNGDEVVWDVMFNGQGNIFLIADEASGVDSFAFVDDWAGAVWNDTGEVVFDLRVLAIEESTELEVKLDSIWPNVSVYAIDIPETGEWTQVAVRFSDLQPNSIEPGEVDYGNIVAPFVMEAVGGTAHVQLNNIRLGCLASCGVEPDGAPSETPVITEDMDIFVDGLSADWGDPGFGVFQQDGQDITIDATVPDPEHGQVIEVEFLPTGFGLFYIQNRPAKDLSAFADGRLVFALQVVDAGSNTGGFTVKADCGYPCTSNELNLPLPGDKEWHTITVPIADLIEGSGFNLATVDTPFAFWPVAGEQGVTFRVANIRWLLE